MKTVTKSTHREISSQWRAFLLVSFFLASCRFRTASFSESSCRLSVGVSGMVSPSRMLTGVSSASDRETSRSESGTDRPSSLS